MLLAILGLLYVSVFVDIPAISMPVAKTFLSNIFLAKLTFLIVKITTEK